MSSCGAGSTWHNELGSLLRIKEVDFNKGTFVGTYCSTVGQAEKEYLAVGRFDRTQVGTIGWTVAWQNKHLTTHSLTTWSGQFQFSEKLFELSILTTWLLTTQTEPEKDWNSTHIGTDTFLPGMPSEEIIYHAKLRCQRSHPQDA